MIVQITEIPYKEPFIIKENKILKEASSIFISVIVLIMILVLFSNMVSYTNITKLIDNNLKYEIIKMDPNNIQETINNIQLFLEDNNFKNLNVNYKIINNTITISIDGSIKNHKINIRKTQAFPDISNEVEI
jgi:DNA integrity scanning protein DisA with diadenylate cyclase activity